MKKNLISYLKVVAIKLAKRKKLKVKILKINTILWSLIILENSLTFSQINKTLAVAQREGNETLIIITTNLNFIVMQAQVNNQRAMTLIRL